MPSEVGAGFVGGGFMARVHSRAARAAGARLTALSSSSAERASSAAAELDVERALAGFDALVADPDVDVVHVCTPNAQHAGQALAALAAGKHVVCEKPIATTAADAEGLVRARDDAGLVGAVPFVYRYHPMVREARARVAAGGEAVLSVDAAYLQDWLLGEDDGNWRAGSDGGASRAFADIGSHLFDLIEFVTGERVTRVSALTRTVFDERAGQPVSNEDIAAVLFQLSGGAPGTALVSQMAAGRKNGLTLEVHTGDAAYRFEQERPEELWIGRRDGALLLPREEGILSSDAARLCRVPSGHPMGYQDAFNAFVADAYAATIGAEPEGLPTFRDGLRAARLTEAVIASARDGVWVDTPFEN
ncbi:Gfo/Idh/MocA family oxidoreductase [Microbacterium betulae]|uniref:Gfo/Idh/MocA family oxidoreductase n=1 Tax=Microbacterium betulae TaxID=2981139 RepID=A0AA97FGX3_9MICO|nr:Gfo/Idh/MocA family oxidoreductase [Microbacterium sp. AB]WOF23346.1 Gfo/Idh/MocA family oxidoreductase [Microbacterium sp. AB]